MIEISVVIPTYNKSRVLEMTLKALSKQGYSQNQFEIIIIDDGSTDGTVERATSLAKIFKYKTTIIRQSHQGPAAARNKGIKKARGRVVLIINDDTIPTADLIYRHADFHQKHPQENLGLLGYVTWHPSLKVTPFMHWLEHGGPYFSFDKIKGKYAGWERLWTCNISFKKEFLLKNGLFDEEFPYAAWEDVELGYRLSKNGLKLLYDKNAAGYHYHPTTIHSIKNKMIANGESALIMKRKIPKNVLPPIAKTPITQLFIFFDFLFYPLIVVLEKVSYLAETKWKIAPIFTLVLLHYRIIGLRKRLLK